MAEVLLEIILILVTINLNNKIIIITTITTLATITITTLTTITDLTITDQETSKEGSGVGDMKYLPVGGRLFKFRATWKGAAYESIIKKGLSWSWEKPPPPTEEFQQQTSPELDRLLKQLRKKRVAEKTKYIKFQSRVFTVPKKNSAEGRWVMDLSKLNAFIKCPKFKMLTMREVRLLLPRNFWSISLDLKDGYWHIPVSRRKRPYLGFRYRKQNWQFRAMPFGLNIAPRIFTKVIAHIVKVMAKEGIWCLPYLDDLLIVAPTKEKCLHHLEMATKILEDFGWIINQEKSRQQPAQNFEWLGLHLDLKSHTVRATQTSMEELQKRLKLVITSKYCSRRKIMRLQGLANWIGQTNQIIRMMMSQTKVILRKFKRQKLDAKIILPKGMKLSLIKWINTPRIPQLLGNPTPTIIIQTDASLKGWGFQINRKTFQGEFDQSMETWSINTLELLTIWFALLMIQIKDQVIQVLCDNSTAVSAVRRSTSTIFHLAMITELIWRRAAMMGWSLTASHIQGKFNVIADQLSRKEALSTEWSLPTRVFRKILKKFPKLQVDLFATHLNNQLKMYVSPCPDQEAIAVDAMTIPWNRWDHLYLYPPTTMIPKVLAKLTESKIKSAILITPEMPTRPWYMALKLRRIPSIPLKVRLQQIVVDKLVKAPISTNLRVWQL